MSRVSANMTLAGGYNYTPEQIAAISAARAARRGMAPATPSSGYWTPMEFNRPAVAYPGQKNRSGYVDSYSDYFSGGGGGSKKKSGGGGGGYSVSGVYVPPEHTLGPGAYWPGHSAERKKQLADSFLSPANAAASGNYAALFAMQAAQKANGNRPLDNWGAATGGGIGAAYQSAYDQARDENSARYRDILAGMQNRYERNMNALRGAGQQEARDINTNYDRQAAARRQSLIARGLGDSTVSDTMQMGNERERTDAQGRLQERLRQQQISLDAQLSGDVLNFMERRDDTYPDLNQLMQLAQGMGEAGYGSGGGGGGGWGGGGGYVSPGGGGGGGMGFFNPIAGMYAGPMGGGGAGGWGVVNPGLTPRQQMFLQQNMAEAARRADAKNAAWVSRFGGAGASGGFGGGFGM